MATKLSIKLRNALGTLELEYDGEITFLERDLPQLLERLLRSLGAGGTGSTASTDNALIGTVRDYFTRQALSNGEVQPLGLDQPVVARTDEQGEFTLPVPSRRELYLQVTAPSPFAPTMNGPVDTENAPRPSVELFAATLADIARQYTTVNVARSSQSATLLVELMRRDGSPIEGVPASDITLLDHDDAPVGTGPFFFGGNGDVQTAADLPVSTAFDGRTRLAFLNVRAGAHRLRVSSTQSTGGGIDRDIVIAGGVTFVAQLHGSD